MKKPTIKHQVIKAISERKEVTRKDIQKFIWVILTRRHYLSPDR